MTWRIDLLAFDGCFGFELFGLSDVLAIANRTSHLLRPGVPPPFHTRVISARGTRVYLAGGASVDTHRANTGVVDQVVVPGFECGDAATIGDLLSGWAPEVGFLRGFGDTPTELASVCVGAFLLAEAGLLDGHEATTAWLFAPDFSRRYPRVNVRAGNIVVTDGRIATSAGFTAGLDLALRIIGRHAGAEVARATSSITLASLARASQTPFVDEKLLPVAHARFSDDVRNWLRHHLAQPYSLSRIATEFNVSTRTLLRRFRDETGESPLSFLQQARIAAAKRLLETSALSVHAILMQVGYSDAATFRRLFADRVGMTPSDYRRQFQHTLD